MRGASESELSGSEWRLYEFIVRHFLASVSPACRFIKTKVRFEINGELFKCSGKRLVAHGFTAIAPWYMVSDRVLPDMTAEHSQPWKLHSVDVVQGLTTAPDYLSESELISLVYIHMRDWIDACKCWLVLLQCC